MHNYIRAFMSRSITAFPVQPAPSRVLRVITQMEQRIQGFIGLKENIPATTTVAAGWTTTRDKLFATKSRDTVAPVAAPNANLCAIDEQVFQVLIQDSRFRFQTSKSKKQKCEPIAEIIGAGVALNEIALSNFLLTIQPPQRLLPPGTR